MYAFELYINSCVPSLVTAGLPDVRERTLVAIKPDGVQRRLVGQIIQRFEQRGFKLVGLKMLQWRALRRRSSCGFKPKTFWTGTAGTRLALASCESKEVTLRFTASFPAAQWSVTSDIVTKGD
ncbi:hypothetical protein XENOCAPTIV_024189 [Xenoophorus captivus]|uniref:Nucleoside diphosphate kinase B n=1 Tax=Xenoophorus captivus TaxID=1517983 RepID=A0ABV0RW09_9TELE